MYGNGKSLLGAVERLESVARVILLRYKCWQVEPRCRIRWHVKHGEQVRVLTLANLQKNGLMSRAHDVWNGAAAGITADMRGVDIPRLSAFNMVD